MTSELLAEGQRGCSTTTCLSALHALSQRTVACRGRKNSGHWQIVHHHRRLGKSRRWHSWDHAHPLDATDRRHAGLRHRLPGIGEAPKPTAPTFPNSSWPQSRLRTPRRVRAGHELLRQMIDHDRSSNRHRQRRRHCHSSCHRRCHRRCNLRRLRNLCSATASPKVHEKGDSERRERPTQWPVGPLGLGCPSHSRGMASRSRGCPRARRSAKMLPACFQG